MAPISTAAPNFTLAEFEAFSNAPLTQQMLDHAVWHSLRLQRVRDAINRVWSPPSAGGDWQVGITSYIRAGARGDHATGAAVDWNVRDRSGQRNDVITRWARDWLFQNEPGSFAELIYEPAFGPEGGSAHVHHARRGFSVDTAANIEPQILDEIEPGKFVNATINLIPQPLRPIALGIAVFGALMLLDGLRS